MSLPGETEAGSAGMQPCRGIAWWAHRDDDRGRGSSPLALFQNYIGSKDPHALKIPARRAECSLTGNAHSPLHAEPRQTALGLDHAYHPEGFCDSAVVRRQEGAINACLLRARPWHTLRARGVVQMYVGVDNGDGISLGISTCDGCGKRNRPCGSRLYEFASIHFGFLLAPPGLNQVCDHIISFRIDPKSQTGERAAYWPAQPLLARRAPRT